MQFILCGCSDVFLVKGFVFGINSCFFALVLLWHDGVFSLPSFPNTRILVCACECMYVFEHISLCMYACML